MGEMAYYSRLESEDDLYPEVEPMLPQGESMNNYISRVGEAGAVQYTYALAQHRQDLALRRGVEPEELHEGPLDPGDSGENLAATI